MSANGEAGESNFRFAWGDESGRVFVASLFYARSDDDEEWRAHEIAHIENAAVYAITLAPHRPDPEVVWIAAGQLWSASLKSGARRAVAGVGGQNFGLCVFDDWAYWSRSDGAGAHIGRTHLDTGVTEILRQLEQGVPIGLNRDQDGPRIAWVEQRGTDDHRIFACAPGDLGRSDLREIATVRAGFGVGVFDQPGRKVTRCFISSLPSEEAPEGIVCVELDGKTLPRLVGSTKRLVSTHTFGLSSSGGRLFAKLYWFQGARGEPKTLWAMSIKREVAAQQRVVWRHDPSSLVEFGEIWSHSFCALP
ncbi:MAG: hypothetical protein R3F62_05765 [Planctomycetota bacterium]